MKTITAVFLLFCCPCSAQTAIKYVEAGLRLQRAGNTADALHQFSEAVQVAPSDARARLLLGTALLDHSGGGSTAIFEALRHLRKAAELSPKEGEYAYQLGRAYQRSAEWSLEKIKEADPQAARLYLISGESFSAEGKTEEATAAFRKAALRDPKMAGAHLGLAFVYARNGKHEQALQELEQELSVAPLSAVALAMKHQLGSIK